MGKLDGKVTIITGAARGQGAAEARLFAAEGSTVVTADLNDAEGKALAEELGGNVVYRHHDVTDEDSWQQLVEEAEKRFGAVHVLVNNAGVYRVGPIESLSVADFDQHYRVNQLGVFLGMRAVLGAMRRAGGGSIINTASGGAMRGGPGVIAYAATKWAVRGMTKCAAIELAEHGIRVNAIHPGIIDTPMIAVNPREQTEFYASLTPMKRLGQPEEVAQVALFLASDASSFVTGGDYTVDGGATA